MAVLTCPLLAFADSDDDDLPTERPSFSSGTKTVAPGRVLIQTGGNFASSHSDTNPLYNLPTGIRFGVVKDFELRLESNSYTIQDKKLGFADLQPGFKWNFFHKGNLSLGAYGGLTIPTGSRSLREIGCMPVIGLMVDTPNPVFMGWQPQFSVLMNWPVDPNTDKNRRFTQVAWASSFTHNITSRMQGFWEFAGAGPTCIGPDGRCPVFVDCGLSYKVNKDLVVDCMLAHGFHHNDTRWTGTVGFTYRLPDFFKNKRANGKLASRHSKTAVATVDSAEKTAETPVKSAGDSTVLTAGVNSTPLLAGKDSNAAVQDSGVTTPSAGKSDVKPADDGQK